ncbi:MAG: CDP-glucose 4,6-dehydratase [Nitrospirae bacterium]|nr:CDP-glucose 4,6-dehydratase [Nitrospirota bacterium]
MIDKGFWKNRKVFLTGHTGFKGSWLCLWLNLLGAKVTGYALDPPTKPSLFKLGNIEDVIKSVISDIRDKETLARCMSETAPEIVIHMAAQPLVRESYKLPFETYETNVMGTVNVFEAARKCSTVRAIINVTSDKCYENKEWVWGYRENEPLGGYDPYSSSKACSELVTSAYRNSFFHPDRHSVHCVGVASARAGNVIGGGDWAADRLLPDCIRALLKGEKILVRNPHSIRPWQHVVEPLSGYLMLAQKLYEGGPDFSGPWNFGPSESDSKQVEWLVNRLCERWGENASYATDENNEQPHETHHLKLDCSKAMTWLGWHPRWDLGRAIDRTVEWTRVYAQSGDVMAVCLNQIEEYSEAIAGS